MSRSPERKDRFPLKEVDGRADPTAAAATPGSYARCSGPLARPPLTAMQNAESGHRPVGRAERRCEYRPAAPHDPRLYEACGDIPPAELETVYYRQNAALAEAGQTTT